MRHPTPFVRWSLRVKPQVPTAVTAHRHTILSFLIVPSHCPTCSHRPPGIPALSQLGGKTELKPENQKSLSQKKKRGIHGASGLVGLKAAWLLNTGHVASVTGRNDHIVSILSPPSLYLNERVY